MFQSLHIENRCISSFLAFLCVVVPNRGSYRYENKVAPVTELGYKTMAEKTELTKFCEDVLKDFKNNITDAVFCYLQNDKELMCRYLELVRRYEKGKQTVNSQLAQAITREYGLKSANQKNETPNSVLIEGFTELEGK